MMTIVIITLWCLDADAAAAAVSLIYTHDLS
jgi:hypothetical protein